MFLVGRSLPELVVHGKKIDRTWLNVGLGLVGVNTGVLVYLAVWLPRVKGDHRPWEVGTSPLTPPSLA